MSEHAIKNDAHRQAARLRDLHAKLHADAAKALGHPKRFLIVHTLADGRERSVTELQEIVKSSQSNVSQNLAILRAAGLVTSRREGNIVYYSIRDARVSKALLILGEVAKDAALDTEAMMAGRELGARRRKILGIAIVGTLVAVVALATLHPLMVGGHFGDVARHVNAMAASPDLGTLFTTCREVAMPAADANTMPAAGPGPA